MDHKDFSVFAKHMVDYIIKYHENIRDRQVLPKVKPGYLRSLIPSKISDTPEKWQDVMNDIERVIMPGVNRESVLLHIYVTHWQSPGFHAYYPSATSYPSIVANMLIDAISCIGFIWSMCPASTELEVVMMDWLCQMLSLPDHFLASSEGNGGGVIQGSGSESILVAMLAARLKTIRKTKLKHPDWSEDEVLTKVICYTSDQGHSSIRKAGLLSGIKVKLIPSDSKNCMQSADLKEAIMRDRRAGLIPSCVVATLGTTSCCAFDNLSDIGPLCKDEEIWLHVDASYAGSAFICPEFRYLMNGVEFADSFNFNPHKLLQVTADFSALWLKDTTDVSEAFKLETFYLKPDKEMMEAQSKEAPDFMNWQIFLNRTFKSLKLWFVLRLYGNENLQKGIRKHIRLAHEFESYVLSDERFEIGNEVIMGLVCFRLKESKDVNESLIMNINQNGCLYLAPTLLNNQYFLRFIVCSWYTESSDVKAAWEEILDMSNQVLAEYRSVT